jgi:hypothetical protein
VNAAYYDLVQQQQQLAALDTTIVISNQRLTLAQNRFTIGKASKLRSFECPSRFEYRSSGIVAKKNCMLTVKFY